VSGLNLERGERATLIICSRIGGFGEKRRAVRAGGMRVSENGLCANEFN